MPANVREATSSLQLDSRCCRVREDRADPAPLPRPRDVYALRWESARTGKSGYVPATVDRWTKSGPKTYLPLSDEAIEQHLRGQESIGVYPLLDDDTCWFLACDFDGGTWQLDALALLEACAEHGVPAALERSRSGDGGHVWIFFSAPVAAGSARRLGALLLREAMTSRAEVDLASYDRLFPNQDFLPAEGVRQPDRAAAAGPLPRRWHERLPRPGNVGALARPVGVPRLDRAADARAARAVARRARRARRRGRAALAKGKPSRQ